MILFEGRKEDVYKKYQKSIDAERKFLSNYMDKASAYDFLLDDPFMKETNYKYLDNLLEHYYTMNEWSGEEGPTNIETARNKLFSIRREIEGLIVDLEIFEKHKSKFKYPDIKKYLPYLQEFFSEVKKVKEDVEKKKVEVAAKKDIDRIFENDTLLIIKPKSHTASCYYGAGTQWCTTMAGNPSYFNQYSSNGTLYYLILKNVDRSNKFYKMAINTPKFENFGTNSVWYDSHDVRLTEREKEAVLAHLPKQAYDIMAKDHSESFKQDSAINLIRNNIKNNDVGGESYVEKFGKKKIKFDFNSITISELDEPNDEKAVILEIEFTISVETKYKGTMYSEDVKTIFSIRPNKTVQPTSNTQYVDVRGDVITQMDDYSDLILKNYKFVMPQNSITEYLDSSIKLIAKKIQQNILTNTNTQILNDEKLREWFGYGARKYTMANYTFTGKGKLTKQFLDYLNNKKEGELGSRLEFLQSIDRPTIPGYLSSFFSALNQAGITEKVGKSGLKKGPNFNKLYNRLQTADNVK
jgi:hypothetical protein